MFDRDETKGLSSEDYYLGDENTSSEISFPSISASGAINGFFQVRNSDEALSCTLSLRRDDRFLATVGNHRKAMLTLWSTKDYSHVLNWQDDFSSSYLNCLAWNPLRTNEFCLGGSHGLIHFCTIGEPADDTNLSLHVVKGELPSLLNEHTKSSLDITTCVYLNSTANLVLCATNYGFITCWNSRLCLCILHWKAEMSEICYLATINEKLLTGSTSGCLKLWNLQNLERNLGQVNSTES